MYEPTLRARLPREVAVPWLEAVVGAVWWTVGAAAFGGAGTIVLAAGLGLTVAMIVAARRRSGSGAPLPRGGRARLVRLVVLTVASITAAGVALGFAGFGELTVPVACALAGAALVRVSSVLGERVLVAAGAALMVVGAGGALLAFESAGRLYPQGVVGLVAGGVLWLCGAHRTGLLVELADRLRR